MRARFRPTTPEDETPLRALLARSFGISPDLPSLRSDMLHWKYWVPRDDYQGPRSFVLERDDKILAHAAIWPLRMRSQNETACGCHMIDWVSDPSSPGSGVALVQKFTAMFDFIYSIGGSQQTQKVLPAFGFRQTGEAWSAARPIHPFRQALTHQYMNWKIPARFLRNTAWSIWPRAEGSVRGLDEWTLTQSSLPVTQQGLSDAARIDRAEGFFRYLQQCPALKIAFFELAQRGKRYGHVVLSFAGTQLQIAGVLMQHSSEESLRAAYILVQKKAKEIGSFYEVDAMGSTDESARAAASCGLRMSSLTPIFLYRRPGGPSIFPTAFEMLDYDGVCRPHRRPAYWT